MKISASGILAKTVGVIGLGLIGYDAHCAGKMTAKQHVKNTKAESLAEHYMDDLKLESPSVIKGAVKEKLFHYHVDENFSGFFHAIAGYFKGFGSMLVSNVIPLGLVAGTLLTKGLPSKLFGAGLAAYGGIFLLQEIFGIGKHE